jgi:hypothetical protein
MTQDIQNWLKTASFDDMKELKKAMKREKKERRSTELRSIITQATQKLAERPSRVVRSLVYFMDRCTDRYNKISRSRDRMPNVFHEQETAAKIQQAISDYEFEMWLKRDWVRLATRDDLQQTYEAIAVEAKTPERIKEGLLTKNK